MKSNKYGFTLGEVLLCVMIMGIIMALSVQSIRIVRSSYTNLTYFAFNTLKNMVGEIYAGDDPGEKLKDNKGKTISSTVAYCEGANNTIMMVLKPDREPTGVVKCNALNLNGGQKTNTFCNALVSISNTIGKTDCENFVSTGYSTEPYITSLNHGSPNFVATNGMRYYISEWTYNSSVSNLYGYRLVGIDLNGLSKPNSTTGTSPDIVTFLVLDNGEVLPLGVAADNVNLGNKRLIKYLNSKVKGYYYAYDPNRTEAIPAECSMKTKDGVFKSCNYAVVNLTNEKEKPLKNGKYPAFFSYRQAYCSTVDKQKLALTKYCSGLEKHKLCPPSNEDKKFDLCLVENVKPMFRFNFK